MVEGLQLGSAMEGFVVTELLKQRTWSDTEYDLYHCRDRTGIEVDVVIELRTVLAPLAPEPDCRRSLNEPKGCWSCTGGRFAKLSTVWIVALIWGLNVGGSGLNGGMTSTVTPVLEQVSDLLAGVCPSAEGGALDAVSPADLVGLLLAVGRAQRLVDAVVTSVAGEVLVRDRRLSAERVSSAAGVGTRRSCCGAPCGWMRVRPADM